MKTEIIKLTAEKPDIELLKKAANVLDAGGLVAFPTETVYGIACPAQPKAIARLDQLKNRAKEKHYTLHIVQKDQSGEYLPKIPLRGQKLISNAWPGPVTIVFELDADQVEKQRQILGDGIFNILYKQNTIGIRCPDNEIARGLLSLAKNPVVAPSANLAGKKPATSSSQVLEQLDGKINMILDGGNTKYQKNSTVVSIKDPKVEILRQGVITQEEITAKSSIQILFVCTGNTCRSPMAQAFCSKFLSEKLNCHIDELPDNGYKIISAGVLGLSGAPASPEVVEICAQNGIDTRLYRSSTLTCADVEQSDYIFVMSTGHRDKVLALCPSAEKKCMLLDSQGQIPDPIGAGFDVYRMCSQQIGKALEIRISEILI